MYKLSFSVNTYDPLELCVFKVVFIYRDPALRLYFLIFLLFCGVQDVADVAPSQ